MTRFLCSIKCVHFLGHFDSLLMCHQRLNGNGRIIQKKWLKNSPIQMSKNGQKRDNKTSFYLRVVFDVIRRTFQTSSKATTTKSSNSSQTIDKDSKHIWQTMKKPSRLMHHGSLYRKDKEKLSKKISNN